MRSHYRQTVPAVFSVPGFVDTLGGPCLLMLLATIAWWPSLGGVFVLDDWTVIVANPAWERWSAGWALVRGSQRWLGDATFLINVQGFGRETLSLHLVNLALHGLTGLALYAFFRRMLATNSNGVQLAVGSLSGPEPSSAPAFKPSLFSGWIAPGDESTSVWPQQLAFVAVAVWLVHPLTTQAVTYIVQRYEVLASLGIVLGLNGYARAEGARGWWYSLLAAGCMVIALGAKQTGVVLPLLTLLYERVFFRGSWRQRLRERGLFYLLTVPLMVGTIRTALPESNPPAPPTSTVKDSAVRDAGENLPSASSSKASVANEIGFAGFEYRAVSPREYLRSQGPVICHYWRLAIWPGTLCFDYAWPVAESPWQWLPGCLVVSGVVLTGGWLWLRGSVVGFLLLAPLVVLAPTSSILPIRDLTVEHRVYLPLAFWLLFLVIMANCWLGMICERWHWPANLCRRSLVVLVLVLLSLRTAWRNADYTSEVRLWQVTAQAAPHNPRASYNLGHALINAAQPSAAIAPLQEAIILSELPGQQRFVTDRERAQNHSRLGTACHLLREPEAAIREYRTGLAFDPASGLIHHNLAQALAMQGELRAAAIHYEQAAALLPRDAVVQLDWGNMLAQFERWDAAIEQFSRALELDVRLIDARVNRGTALIQAGRIDAGVRDLQVAREQLPSRHKLKPFVERWLTVVAGDDR